jgi:hypothetical protein
MDDKPTLKKAVVWSLRKFGKYLSLLQFVNKEPAQNLIFLRISFGDYAEKVHFEPFS